MKIDFVPTESYFSFMVYCIRSLFTIILLVFNFIITCEIKERYFISFDIEAEVSYVNDLFLYIILINKNHTPLRNCLLFFIKKRKFCI